MVYLIKVIDYYLGLNNSNKMHIMVDSSVVTSLIFIIIYNKNIGYKGDLTGRTRQYNVVYQNKIQYYIFVFRNLDGLPLIDYRAVD